MATVKKPITVERALSICMVIIGFFCSFMIYGIDDRLKSIETKLLNGQLDAADTRATLRGHGDLINYMNARLTDVEKNKLNK